MLRVLIALSFFTSLSANAEIITKGISSSFLEKVTPDGDIENSFINEESLEIGFNTRSKLWVWNIKNNKLKSIKINSSSLRSSDIQDIYFYDPYWVVESHNRLVFIDIINGKKKYLYHPKLKQGYSLGIDKANENLFWAHTDGSLKIDLRNLGIEFYSPAITEDIGEATQIASDIFFIKHKLVFKISNDETKLIFHSPKNIQKIRSDKNFLMLSTKDSIIQLSPKGEVIKTISHRSEKKFRSFKISKNGFHCFLFEDGSLKSFNLTKQTETDFKLTSQFDIADYDCRGEIAVLSNKDNLLILADYKKKSYSRLKSKKQKI